MMRLTGLLTFILLLAGCQYLPENRGIDVDVYPVTYQISLDMAESTRKADLLWQKFYTRHQRDILTSQIDFFYQSQTGEKKASQWREELINQGAATDNLKLYHSGDLKPFDLQIKLMTWKTVTPICHRMAVGHMNGQTEGCFVDGAIWQSAAHPEDALPDENQ